MLVGRSCMHASGQARSAPPPATPLTRLPRPLPLSLQGEEGHGGDTGEYVVTMSKAGDACVCTGCCAAHRGTPLPPTVQSPQGGRRGTPPPWPPCKQPNPASWGWGATSWPPSPPRSDPQCPTCHTQRRHHHERGEQCCRAAWTSMRPSRRGPARRVRVASHVVSNLLCVAAPCRPSRDCCTVSATAGDPTQRP